MIKFNSALSGLTLSFRILHPFLLLRLLQLNLIFVLKCFHLVLGWNCHDLVLPYILKEVNYYKILNIQINLKYKLANFSNKPVCIFCHYLKKKKRIWIAPEFTDIFLLQAQPLVASCVHEAACSKKGTLELRRQRPHHVLCIQTPTAPLPHPVPALRWPSQGEEGINNWSLNQAPRSKHLGSGQGLQLLLPFSILVIWVLLLTDLLANNWLPYGEMTPSKVLQWVNEEQERKQLLHDDLIPTALLNQGGGAGGQN